MLAVVQIGEDAWEAAQIKKHGEYDMGLEGYMGRVRSFPVPFFPSLITREVSGGC